MKRRQPPASDHAAPPPGVGSEPRAPAVSGDARRGAVTTQAVPPALDGPPVSGRQGREPMSTEPAPGSAEAPAPIDPSSLLEPGPGLAVAVADGWGRERTEIFRRGEVTIGRGADNDLVLDDGSVSRCHAMLTHTEGGGCTVFDLGSTNGSFVDGVAIGTEPALLVGDEVLTVGAFALRVAPLPLDEPDTLFASPSLSPPSDPVPSSAGGPHTEREPPHAGERRDTEVPRRAPATMLAPQKSPDDDLGSLDALIGRADIDRIAVRGGVIRAGRGRQLRDVGARFSSEEAVASMLRGLGRPDGASPWSCTVRGFRLTAIGPEHAPQGHVVDLRRLEAAEGLAGWMRRGALSQAMVEALGSAMRAESNVLVAGDGALVETLARQVPAAERIWIGQRRSEDPCLVGRDLAAAVAQLPELSCRHVFATDLDDAALSALVWAIGRGREGVVLHLPGPRIEVALGRAAARVAMVTPCAPEVAHAALEASFGLAVEVTSSSEGARVARIAEMAPGVAPADRYRARPSGGFETIGS